MPGMLLAAVGLVAGGALGLRLGARRVPRAFVALPHPLWWGAASLFALAAALTHQAHRLPWLPAGLVLQLETAFLPVTLALAGFGIGLLAAFEWRAPPDVLRRFRAVLAVGVLGTATAFLLLRSRPVGDLLTAPVVVDGVVLQTTSYTCTPAALATLLRLRGDTGATERELAVRTRTTRTGTHTRHALAALADRGLHAAFVRGLTPDDLLAHGGRAILHVNQPTRRGTTRHTVVLLSIDAATRTVTLANPLTGRQVLGFDELEGYWYGEGMLVD